MREAKPFDWIVLPRESPLWIPRRWLIADQRLRHGEQEGLPEAVLAPLDIEVQSADEFLLSTFELYPGAAEAAIRAMRKRHKNPHVVAFVECWTVRIHLANLLSREPNTGRRTPKTGNALYRFGSQVRMGTVIGP